jgi:oxygen-independent coproporphyrinogen-3 oxidase
MADRIDWREITKPLLDKYGGQAPRYTSYPTAPEWASSFSPDQYLTALGEPPEDPQSSLSIYIHIPFCKKRCRFCGCASDVSDDAALYDAYLDAVEREAATVASVVTTKGVRQLHLGGGTPTVLSPDQLKRLTGIITTHFDLTPSLGQRSRGVPEIALEAAPSVTTREQISALADLGFNRISMGVQDFTPEVQQAVDRPQSVDHTRALIELARRRGFGVNIDLMYGLPKQRPETWRATLDTVIDIRPNRLAVFGYAHVPWMRPHQRALDERDLPNTDQRLRLFQIAHDTLLDAGYVYIGMDHFALPDDELARALNAGTLSRNFQGYTVKQASRLIGLGATAISDLGTAFAQNQPDTSRYMAVAAGGAPATYRGMRTSAEDRLRRRIITELMCNLKLDIGAVEAEFGITFADHFKAELARLSELEADRLVRVDRATIAVTGRGRMFVRHVGMVFDAYLSRRREEMPRFSRTV